MPIPLVRFSPHGRWHVLGQNMALPGDVVASCGASCARDALTGADVVEHLGGIDGLCVDCGRIHVDRLVSAALDRAGARLVR